ncbi:MAG: 2,3-bisphosphoglycerate-independent phosphoglycerate mutase [Kiritimatiellaeota bacterium]|nr:2,3-bisphosphoglycerate-independent phosphoglycerate mutase [Kiritimatiellota bacterium]
MKTRPYQTVLFLGDGMADESLAALDGRTPLQAARTPNMDLIARKGRSGTMLTLPDGFPTSSDVANMSVLGCDLATELCGRGPLEAASQGIALDADDVAFRMNLVTLDDGGILRDFSGGHIAQPDAEETIALLNAELGTDKIRFCPGVSYRNLLILSGAAFSADVACDKPDDSHGCHLANHLPRPEAPAGAHTAFVLNTLISRARVVLRDRAANAIWPWSGGKPGAIHNICQRYGIRAAVISAVDVINGLGACMGMDVIKVQGATGYIDTNYEAKADAVLKALADGYDFVYAHVEAMDEVSHAQDLDLKIKTIEDFDARLVGRVMHNAKGDVAYAVLPDHPVPIATGKHTRTPVPVAVRQPGVTPDAVQSYDEVIAAYGTLGRLQGRGLMDLLLG